MSATTSTNTKANKNGNKPSTLPQHDTQKSFTIIALTGFAGSLVGLSISRSRTRSAIALGAQLNDAAHSQAASLPIVFAISTAAFASIIEYSKILSPTRVLMGILREQGLIDDSPKVKDDQQQLWDDDCTATLGDYAIGGTIAGALFTGGSSGLVEKTLLSALQSPRADAKNISTNITFASGTDKQKSMIGKGKVVTLANKKILEKGMKRKGMIPTVQTTSGPTVSGPKFGTTPLPRPKIMSGLTTGLLLGLVAGVAQISLTKLEQFLQSQTEVDKEDVDDLVFGGERKDGSNEKPVWTQKQEEDLDDKIKNMSTEEIQREIDALRKRFQ